MFKSLWIETTTSMKRIVTILCFVMLFSSGVLMGQHILLSSSPFQPFSSIIQVSSSDEIVIASGNTLTSFSTATVEPIDRLTLLSNPYPNPARSHTKLDYELPKNTGEVVLTLLDLIGNVAASHKIIDPKGTIEINTSQLNSGVYFIYMKTADEILTSRKLIVSK